MKEIIYRILWASIEEFVGLWEILWEVSSVFPEKNKTENQEMIKKILLYLLENDLVTFYFDKWGKEYLNEMNFDKSIKVLNQEQYWDAPQLNNICIKIGSTEKGEKFYNEELLNDFIL